MIDKKALKEQYKQIKHEMGVFCFKCRPTNKAYLGHGQNIKADINSLTFQLKLGNNPANTNLVNDWKKYGESNFEVSVLEILKYDKDETKTDYTKDLQLLRDILAEQFPTYEYIK